MTIKSHLLLKTMAQGTGFLVGGIVAFQGGQDFSFLGIPFPFSAAFALLMGTYAGILLFKFIPATCPKCGGAAYPEGLLPVDYVCRSCGYRHEVEQSRE